MSASRDQIERALAALPPEVWKRVGRNVFAPDSRGEVRVAWAGDGLLGLSRAQFCRDGRTMRRALVIAPAYQGSAESLELTLSELHEYFARGIREVEYVVRRDHAAATGRVLLLGAELEHAGLHGFDRWKLTVDTFEAGRGRLEALAEQRWKKSKSASETTK